MTTNMMTKDMISEMMEDNGNNSDCRNFDIIGDVHGCIDELELLLKALGYQKHAFGYVHPKGRKAVFVGDLCDRGPGSLEVLSLVMMMVKAGEARMVLGNHDDKLLRALKGRNIQMNHGIDVTLSAIEKESREHIEEIKAFLDARPLYLVLDGGRLLVAHAGMKTRFVGRCDSEVRTFCLYGDVSGEFDEYGMPIRGDWASKYHGSSVIVYGHEPHREPRMINRTYGIDTACAFGGKLTALRYPEKTIVQVNAKQQYADPIRPVAP